MNTPLDFDSQTLLQNKVKKKRVPTKISKMHENNQYGNAITKHLRYRCIKKTPEAPTLFEFNKIRR